MEDEETRGDEKKVDGNIAGGEEEKSVRRSRRVRKGARWWMEFAEGAHSEASHSCILALLANKHLDAVWFQITLACTASIGRRWLASCKGSASLLSMARRLVVLTSSLCSHRRRCVLMCLTF